MGHPLPGRISKRAREHSLKQPLGLRTFKFTERVTIFEYEPEPLQYFNLRLLRVLRDTDVPYPAEVAMRHNIKCGYVAHAFV